MGEIHIYTGGTAGARDGTQVSEEGTKSNPLNFGIIPVGQESSVLTFAIRSALGRKTQVPPILKGHPNLNYSKDNVAWVGYGTDLTWGAVVGDTNQLGWVKARVLAGDFGTFYPKINIDVLQPLVDITGTPTLSTPAITATSPQAKVVRINLTAATSNVGAAITYDVYIGGVLKDSGVSAFVSKDYTVNAGTYDVYVVAKDTANSLTQNSNTVTGLVVAAPTLSTPAITATSPTYNSISVTLTTQSTSNAGVTPTYDVYIDGALTESNLAASALTSGKTYNIASGTHSIMVRAKDTANNLTADSATITGIIVSAVPSNQAPVASSVSVSGTTTKGSTLTGNYTYSDAESDPQGTSTFRWLRNGVAIAGATAKTYVLVEADLGATIKFEVTPVATTGTLAGTPVQSSGTSIPIPAPPSLNTPTVGNGKITCSFTQNSSLATETYNAYYTIDGTTPTTSSTKLTGVTSPFDISASNDLTVKVRLEMVVNSVASALSSTVSGVPTSAGSITPITETFDVPDGNLDANLWDISRSDKGTNSTASIVNNKLQLNLIGNAGTAGQSEIRVAYKQAIPIHSSVVRTITFKRCRGSLSDYADLGFFLIPSPPLVTTDSLWFASTTGFRLIEEGGMVYLQGRGITGLTTDATDNYSTTPKTEVTVKLEITKTSLKVYENNILKLNKSVDFGTLTSACLYFIACAALLTDGGTGTFDDLNVT